MPDWAYVKWLKTEWAKSYNCSQGGERERPELTFVINGVDYSLPSHHWNERVQLWDDVAECEPTIHELTINQPGQ